MVERETIEYDGKVWYRYPNAKRSSDRNYYQKCGKFLHHYVWEKYNGVRKKGYQIHHKDGNFANNSIENLEEITIKEHQCIRHKMSEERRQKQREWCDKIRPYTKEWHKSEEGTLWHKQHAQQHNFGHIKYGERKCQVCGKIFEAKTNHQKFCSNVCKSKYRRLLKLDEITNRCEWCGNEFKTNKYSKARFCSRHCARSFAWKNRKESI